MKLSQVLKTWRVVGGNILLEFFGGILTNAASSSPLVRLTYVSGVAIAIDASRGNFFTIPINDAAAFSFAAPTNPPPSGFAQEITITIRNTSGGALGAGTWNAIFKTSGAVPAIANGFNRAFSFIWDGAAWVQKFASAADVAN